MIICIKKVNEKMDFRDILNPTTEDFKAIIGADILSTVRINENIVCLYDYDNLTNQSDYNFILLEEIKGELELIEAIKGTVIFVKDTGDGIFKQLEEADASYLIVNYMSNTAKDVYSKKRFDTLEINAI